MKLLQIIILIGLIAAALAGIGYSYRATWNAGHTAGHDEAVADSASKVTAAEDKGRKDQEQADAHAMQQLQGQLDDAKQAVSNRQADLDDAAATITALKGKLRHDQDPSDRHWLDLSLPCSLQHPPACPSPAAGNPGH